MPLVVISGIPCSGKTTRCEELKAFFQEKGKSVIVIDEHEQMIRAGFDRNSIYLDSNQEKHLRGLLKSEVLRHITPTNVVLLDGLNYIKGFRYELYCSSKANKCTQCTVHAEINRQEAKKLNENRKNNSEKYSDETFDSLVMRYEEPDGRNRWDSPLFLVFPGDELDKEAIFTCLFDKSPPPPNKSTENAPLSSTNFLYHLDQETKKIMDSIIQVKKSSPVGKVKIPGYEDLQLNVGELSISRLNRLRRQYIVYSTKNPPNPSQITQLFIQYLNVSLT